MHSRSFRIGWATALLVFGGANLVAQPGRDSTKESARDPRASANSQRGAKGPLPDPALLDGSALEAEKRPDYGMLGEFEMPGDENAKGDRVGKTSDQPKGSAGGGAQQQQQNSIAVNAGGGGSQGAQSAGGGAQGAQSS